MKARAGFTLIEVLIVTVVVGILAAIGAITTRRAAERAYMAAVQADVRQLAVHQELFHNLNHRYGALSEVTSFRVTEGVNIEVTYADASSFAVTASHAALLGSQLCGYYIGGAAAANAGPATEEARLTCD